MKKIAAFCMTGLIILGGVGVYATGGSSTDPLVSTDYLNDTYVPNLTTQIESYIASTTQSTYNQALSDLTNTYETQLKALDMDGIWLEDRVKEGDIMEMEVGSSIMLYSGTASFSFSTGSVINVTTGTTVTSGTTLAAYNRYIIGEGAAVDVIVNSETAVVTVSGGVVFNESDSVDYNALADSLYAAGLFQGTGSVIGSGYTLEREATRTEGLVMFIRILGEEEAALNYEGECPFVDASSWSKSYLAYAYDMGYTKGVGTDSSGNLIFGASNTLSAKEYITFVLRALGYDDSSDNPDFTWSTTLDFALSVGVITQGEYDTFTTDTFMRSHVVYVSYFALTTPTKNSTSTLLDVLNENGTVDGDLLYDLFIYNSVNRM